MKRRDFISKGITGILSAFVAPMILQGAGRLWKRSEAIWVPNPAWINAPYEDMWIIGGSKKWLELLKPGVFPSDMGLTTLKDPLPKRFEFVDGKYIEVLPWLKT